MDDTLSPIVFSSRPVLEAAISQESYPLLKVKVYEPIIPFPMPLITPIAC